MVLSSLVFGHFYALALARDASGNLLLRAGTTTGTRIRIIDPDGRFGTLSGDGDTPFAEGMNPSSLDVGDQGRIAVDQDGSVLVVMHAGAWPATSTSPRCYPMQCGGSTGTAA